jgi:hypothetical protein
MSSSNTSPPPDILLRIEFASHLKENQGHLQQLTLGDERPRSYSLVFA